MVGQFERHGVDAVGGVVHQHYSGGFGKGLACLFDCYVLFCLDPYGFGVGAHHRHAYAHGADADVGGVHDFACLVEHLHLLFGVAVVGELVYVGDDVIGQLCREFLDCRFLAA